MIEDIYIIEPFIPYQIHCILKNKRGCKDMYQILCDKSQFQLPTAVQKWNSTMMTGIKSLKSHFR